MRDQTPRRAPLEGSGRGRATVASEGNRVILVVALCITLTLQLARVFFTLVFDLGERTGGASGAVRAGGLAVMVFLAPAVAPLLSRLVGPRRCVVATLGAVALFRMAIQVMHPVPLWLAAAATAAALVATCLLAVALVSGGGPPGPHRFVLGILIGLAVDTALRGAFWSWDHAWRAGPVPIAVTALTIVAMLAPVATRGGRGVRASGGGGGMGAAAIGPFLLLHVLFLHNVPFAASSARVSVPIAVAVALGGDALALIVVAWVATGGSTRPPWPVATGGLVALAFLLRLAAGPALLLVLLGAHVLAGGFLAVALDRDTPRSRGSILRTSLAFAGGTAGFMALVVLYQIGYRIRLPFPNIIVAPAAALALSMAGIGWSSRRPARSVPRRGLALAVLPAVLLLVPAGMLLFGAHPAATPGTGRSLRLVSWNVHLGIGQGGQLDPEAMARAIEGEHADVVALQEVARGWPGGGGIDLAAWLSQRLGMPFVFGPAADDQFGNAILSRLPISDSTAVSLPRVDAAMRRSYLAATVDVGGGRRLTLVDAHLEGASPEHAAQTDRLLTGWGGTPVTVIAGDMNMQPQDPDRARFAQAGLASAQDLAGREEQSTATRPAFPGDRVDWIFGTADLTFSHFRIGSSTASDHRPLAVTVTVP